MWWGKTGNVSINIKDSYRRTSAWTQGRFIVAFTSHPSSSYSPGGKLDLPTQNLLEKQKAAMDIKKNPASCHQVDLPNCILSLIFVPSTSFSICRHQRALMQLQLLGHPCVTVPKVPLPSSILVAHLHTTVVVPNELRQNTPPKE